MIKPEPSFEYDVYKKYGTKEKMPRSAKILLTLGKLYNKKTISLVLGIAIIYSSIDIFHAADTIISDQNQQKEQINTQHNLYEKFNSLISSYTDKDILALKEKIILEITEDKKEIAKKIILLNYIKQTQSSQNIDTTKLSIDPILIESNIQKLKKLYSFSIAAYEQKQVGTLTDKILFIPPSEKKTTNFTHYFGIMNTLEHQKMFSQFIDYHSKDMSKYKESKEAEFKALAASYVSNSLEFEEYLNQEMAKYKPSPEDFLEAHHD